MFFPRRGAVYKLKIESDNDSLKCKAKYAVIIQNNVGNQYSSVVIVSPVCEENDKISEIDVPVSISDDLIPDKAIVKLNHIYSIDKSLLDSEVAQLSPDEMYGIDLALELSLGLVSI